MRIHLQLSIAILLSVIPMFQAEGAVRIKDIALVSGARDNQLVGYGLVSGLAGDGDQNPVHTLQMIANMLQRFGITVPASTLSTKNVAAVMVTADIHAFAKSGARLDVTVSSLGDAKTLQGGVLMQTPLLGADGKVYAVAQGAISLGGGLFSGAEGGGGGASVQKNHPTTAEIPGGALVEQEIPATVVRNQFVELLLRQPDFTTAARVAAAINEKFNTSSQALDSTTVRVKMPEDRMATPIDFIAGLEAVEVEPDVPARIVINEKTGTIVATTHVSISRCAVSHGNVTITIEKTPEVSQPAPFSGGKTTVTQTIKTSVTEKKVPLGVLPEMPTVEKVATALSSLGVPPRDMMAIFQAMKQAGALQAELVLR